MADSSPAHPQVYVLAAHPDLEHSHVTAALVRAARDLPGVEICDLYARYPDFHIDVAAEQDRLQQVRALVWLHPLHWYSMPALLKLWLDEVLRHGWAYGTRATDGTPTQALRGKALWLATSAGGARDAYSAQGYNQHPLDVFLTPYRQTAALCGLCWQPPLVLYGAHRISDTELNLHLTQWTTGLQRLAGTGASSAVSTGMTPDAQPVIPVTDRPVP